MTEPVYCWKCGHPKDHAAEPCPRCGDADFPIPDSP